MWVLRVTQHTLLTSARVVPAGNTDVSRTLPTCVTEMCNTQMCMLHAPHIRVARTHHTCVLREHIGYLCQRG